MAIARCASEITLPVKNLGWKTILEFLDYQFPLIGKQVWQNRILEGKVHWHSGEAISLNSTFQPSKRLCYYREVEEEPKIPFTHKIIYQNEHLLVACKPHFLPVTPGAEYVNECLLERIRQQTGLTDIVPLHRLDRDTAGLVMFSLNPDSRNGYYQLFAERKIEKRYLAIAHLGHALQALSIPHSWQIMNRLEKSKPSFTMTEVKGDINARSKIKLVSKQAGLGLFELFPETGKTHQLRLHMMRIGVPILNDRFYPRLLPKVAPQFDKPLQLLAKNLSFVDPVSGIKKEFESERKVELWSVIE
ncbi:pseudouridine synthase [Aliikangiella sp. IMCC44359]|uniref:pseudouridine synthase n=1 Tax=Aliikangiella sp. IMCC44359 TaxID=3459125 RepID=UPI00403AF208